MSDWQYYCPRCEEAIAKWDFQAPPDFYRCFLCGLATPFIQLPRRNVLKHWAFVRPQSLRIPRGTGGTIGEFDQDSTTIASVTCGKGSTLVVGAGFNKVGGVGSPPTSFSFTWNGQTSTQAVFQSDGANSSAAIAYLTALSSAASDLVVTPSNGCEMSAFVTEITIPAQPVFDTSGGVLTSVGHNAVSCSSTMTSPLQMAISSLGPPFFAESYDSPFSIGQQVIGGGIQCEEAFATVSAPGPAAIGITTVVGQPIAIATFGVTG